MTKHGKPAAIIHRHLFAHYCRSGNVIYMTVRIPVPGQKAEFDILWANDPSKADQKEKSRWLEAIAMSASAIAGRSLTVSMQPVKLAAVEEAA
jgi:hypothetical protein